MHARMHAILWPVPRRKTSPKKGPKGGDTTVTAGGLLKKTVYFSPEEWSALRRLSFEEERSVSEIVREFVRDGLEGG